MAKYIERQGKDGERKIAKVRHSFGGSVDHQDRVYSKLCRQAVIERDDRRIFSRQVEGEVEEYFTAPSDVARRTRHDENFNAATGIYAPSNGGIVFVDECSSSNRRARVVFGPNGKLVAAHF